MYRSWWSDAFLCLPVLLSELFDSGAYLCQLFIFPTLNGGQLPIYVALKVSGLADLRLYPLSMFPLSYAAARVTRKRRFLGSGMKICRSDTTFPRIMKNN